MPFKSQDQRKKLASLVKTGELSQSKFDEFAKNTPKKLPKRITPKIKKRR